MLASYNTTLRFNEKNKLQFLYYKLKQLHILIIYLTLHFQTVTIIKLCTPFIKRDRFHCDKIVIYYNSPLQSLTIREDIIIEAGSFITDLLQRRDVLDTVPSDSLH